jgi:RHS repeat-associated protein
LARASSPEEASNWAGNLTAVKRSAEGEITTIEDSYTYDGTNLRQTQTINGTKTNLTWDTAEPIPIILEDETNNYIYGPENLPIEQISTSGTVLYLHHDQQGSTRLLTNTSGNTETAYTYNPYGTLEASTGTATTALRYDAQYTSTDTGLIYLRARTYDPPTAQFLTVDPAFQATDEPYAYGGDDPLDETDPRGECAQPDRCAMLQALIQTRLANAQTAINNAQWALTQAANVQAQIDALWFFQFIRRSELIIQRDQLLFFAEQSTAAAGRLTNEARTAQAQYSAECARP